MVLTSASGSVRRVLFRTSKISYPAGRRSDLISSAPLLPGIQCCSGQSNGLLMISDFGLDGASVIERYDLQALDSAIVDDLHRNTPLVSGIEWQRYGTVKLSEQFVVQLGLDVGLE